MQRSAYTFRDYRIDLARRELRRADELLTPSVKVFDCIAYLLEHRERAVGRDELLAAVWGRTDVTYAILGQLVIKARRTLGGSGDDQQAIRTLPRFGYRWVAEVIREDGGDTPRSEAEPPATPATNVRRTRSGVPAWLILVLAVVALGATVAVGLPYFRTRTAVVAGGAPARITGLVAVLPVSVQADGPWSWVRLGVMDLIADRLRSAGLPVVPSENVIALARDPARAADAVRDATGAQRIVAARASLTEAEWSVHLTLTSAQGVDRTVEARAEDVITAAQSAADQLLTIEGVRTSPPEAPGQLLVTLLARARSEMLKNDVDAARRILASAPAELQKSPDLRRWLAKADDRSGRLDAARVRLDALLGEIGAESNPRLRAAVLNDLGVVALHSNQLEAATRRFDESLALLANDGDPAELGRAHMGRGVADALQGRYDHASSEFGRARLAYGVSGHAVALATIEVNEAALEMRHDRPAAARPMLERAAQLFEQLGARHELFAVQATRMKVERALLEPAHAYAIAAGWAPRLDELQSPQVRQEFLLESAYAQTATGRLKEAKDTLDSLARELGSGGERTRLSFMIHGGRAQIAFVEGRFAAALDHAARVVDGLVLPDDTQIRASAWLTVVRALTALGRDAEAATQLRQFVTWASTSDFRFARMYAVLAEAERADREGRRETARQSWESALREASRSGVPSHLAEVADSYGTRLLAWGDLERAGTIIGSAGRYAADDFRCALLVARLQQALGRSNDWRIAMQQVRVLAGERPVPREVAPASPAGAPPTP